MKAKDLKNLRAGSSEDLAARLHDLKEELFNLRFQHATGQLENPMRIKEVKKTYARIKTIMQERAMKSDQA